MPSKELLVDLLQKLKTAEQLADRPQLISIVHELGELEEYATEIIPHLLSIFTRNYEVPELRNALKEAFANLGFDITPYERFEKLRLPTRLLLLFGLIMLNGTLFGWGSALYYPYGYEYLSETATRLMEMYVSDEIMMPKGNYYWMLVIFLITTLYCLFYLAYLLYLFRPFSSFPVTGFWMTLGLLFPLFALFFGIYSIDPNIDSWIVIPSKTTLQQILTLGFISSLFCFLVNLQFTTFVNGLLQGTLESHLRSTDQPASIPK